MQDVKMKQPVYQKGELLSPEELRKVGSLPLHIKGAGWEDDQTADDCQTWDGEHQTANISFDQKQQFLGKRGIDKSKHDIIDSIGEEEKYKWSASDGKIQKLSNGDKRCPYLGS